jgi:YD repeat-containing protein
MLTPLKSAARCILKSRSATKLIWRALWLMPTALLLLTAQARSAPSEWTTEIFDPALSYQSSVTGGLYSSANAACAAGMPQPYVSGNVQITHSNPADAGGRSCSYTVEWYDPWTTITTTETVTYQNRYDRKGGCPENAVPISGKCHRSRPPVDVSACVGNPVRSAGGYKVQYELDYAASGSQQQALRFERQFSSRHLGSHFGALGRNWFIRPYERSLRLSNQASTSYVHATRELGHVRLFTLSNNQWAGEPYETDRLEALSGAQAPAVWKYHDTANDSSEFYDAGGQLLSIQAASGLTTTLTYSDTGTPTSIAPGPGYLIGVIDGFGRQLNLRYNSQGLLLKLIDPANQEYLYTYDEDANASQLAAHRLTSVTYPDLKRRQYHYEPSGLPVLAASIASFPIIFDLPSGGTTNYPQVLVGERAAESLTGITDENNQRFASYAYDSYGRATTTTHAGGVQSATLTFNADGSTSVTDALGTTRVYRFQTVQGVRRMSSVSQPCSSCGGSLAASTIYDSAGNVASKKDFNGNLMCYTHDPARNLETQRMEGLTGSACPGTAVAGVTRTTSTEWHPTWRLPKRIAEPKRITTFVYHGDAGVTCGATGALCSKTVTETTDTTGSLGFSATTSTNTRSWTYTYNSFGQVLTVNGPRTDVSDITTYAYYTANDASGNFRIGDLASVTNALGHLTQITHYDAHGKPKRIVDANGLVTQLDYWPRGWLKSRNVGGLITLFDYDGVGQRVTVNVLARFDFSDRVQLG